MVVGRLGTPPIAARPFGPNSVATQTGDDVLPLQVTHGADEPGPVWPPNPEVGNVGTGVQPGVAVASQALGMYVKLPAAAAAFQIVLLRATDWGNWKKSKSVKKNSLSLNIGPPTL